jgi:hypothetical protein
MQRAAAEVAVAVGAAAAAAGAEQPALGAAYVSLRINDRTAGAALRSAIA